MPIGNDGAAGNIHSTPPHVHDGTTGYAAPPATGSQDDLDPGISLQQSGTELAKREHDAAIKQTRTAYKQAKAAQYFQAQPTSAYLTEERERQKVRNQERKKVGTLAKTRKIPVEAHYNDCGIDLTGLGKTLPFMPQTLH